GGGNKPSLPTGNTTQTSTISTVHATTPSSEPYIVTPKSGAVIGRTNLKLDTNAEVLIYLAASGTVSDTQDADWRAYLPANTTTPLVEFSSANINKTLLYAALYPVPLTGILDAVKTETNYEKQTVNGKPAAHYKYGLDAGKLKVYLPSGATISQPAAEIVYLWNGGQPVSSILTGTLSYQGHTYQLKESENYLQWNGSSAATSTNPAIMKLTGTDGSGQAPSVVSVSDFIAQLGIANLQSVPNTLSSSTGTTIQPITPTGQTVTSVSSPLTTVPPLPAATPSDQAKQRDIQRLADLGDLQQALENYKAAKGSYPVTTTLQQTRSSQLLLNDLVPTYLTGLPVDPLPNTFWYEYQSDGKGYVLRSVAEDSTNSKAVKGKAYYYYQLTGGTPQQ
ncbi:type II secretion system protein GspG, partial [Patescibacteria group bacterium]|nr:type II secretion system protein GspG [Patescibacteria group bacterium]